MAHPDHHALKIEYADEKEKMTVRTNIGMPVQARLVKTCRFTDTVSGKTIDLLRLLPTGYQLADAGEYEINNADPINRIITVDLQHVEPGTLLSMLHEVGHAHLFERLAAQGKSTNGMTPVQEERGAWGWALVKLKELASDGIQLEPTMDRTAVKNFIKKHLLSYEFRDVQRMIDSDASGMQPQFWPPLQKNDIDAFVRECADLLDGEVDPREASRALKKAFFGKKRKKL